MLDLRNLRLASTDPQIWESRSPSLLSLGNTRARYEAQRQEMMAAVLRRGSAVYLHYSEDPVRDGLQGRWVRLGRATWRVPPEADVAQLYGWLQMGGWALVGRCDAVDGDLPRPDLFGPLVPMDPTITWMMAAFWDNDPWRWFERDG